MRICIETSTIKIDKCDKLLHTREHAVIDLCLVRDVSMTSYHYTVDIEMEICDTTVGVNILIPYCKYVGNFIGSLY